MARMRVVRAVCTMASAISAQGMCPVKLAAVYLKEARRDTSKPRSTRVSVPPHPERSTAAEDGYVSGTISSCFHLNGEKEISKHDAFLALAGSLRRAFREIINLCTVYPKTGSSGATT